MLSEKNRELAGERGGLAGIGLRGLLNRRGGETRSDVWVGGVQHGCRTVGLALQTPRLVHSRCKRGREGECVR